MQTATETAPAATLPKVQLPCPKCGCENADLSLNLATLDDEEGDNVTCRECEESFSLATVRAIVAKWGPMLRWIDSIPTPPDAE